MEILFKVNGIASSVTFQTQAAGTTAEAIALTKVEQEFTVTLATATIVTVNTVKDGGIASAVTFLTKAIQAEVLVAEVDTLQFQFLTCHHSKFAVQ